MTSPNVQQKRLQESSGALSTLQIETPRAFVPLLSSARYKGARGGRGSGKSHFFAELLIEESLCSHQRIACVREIQNSIKDSVKRLLEDKIAKFGLGSFFRSTETEIRGPNGSLFIFRGLQNHTADSIKSLEGFTRAWVEEAHSITQRSLDVLTPTFRSGSEMLFSWNPDSPQDPVDRLFEEGKGDPDFVLVEANYRDNPFFPEELRADMERDKRRDPEKYRHIWLGKYRSRSEATVFRNWKEGVLEVPRGTRPYFGADWGFAIDPTVLVRCWPLPGRVLYIDREVYQVGCEIDHTPSLFRGINDDLVQDIRLWPIRADSARPETISYMQRQGFKIIGAIKGAGSVNEGVAFMQSVDIVVHPRCRHVIDELASYSWKVDKRTDFVLPELEDKKNHTIDSVRYAMEDGRNGFDIATYLKAYGG